MDSILQGLSIDGEGVDKAIFSLLSQLQHSNQATLTQAQVFLRLCPELDLGASSRLFLKTLHSLERRTRTRTRRTTGSSKRNEKKKMKESKLSLVGLGFGRDEIEKHSGVSMELFMEILGATASDIEAPQHRWGFANRRKRGRENKRSPTSLSTGVRLLAVLNFLRTHPTCNNQELMFRTPAATLRRDRRHILPILAAYLRKTSVIKWPDTTQHDYPDWKGSIGSVDGKAHPRRRPGALQAWYYRGDKHTTFINAQLVCSLDGGEIFEVSFVRGHLNDQGFYFFFQNYQKNSSLLKIISHLFYFSP